MIRRSSSDTKRIQAIFYNNPDIYPPIINSSRLLAQHGFNVDMLCRDYGGQWNVAYPATVRVRRLRKRAKSSWQEYFQFAAQVLRTADKSASVFVGHDMHGFLPAKLLATRFRRPLVYHCHDFAERERTIPFGSRVVRGFEGLFARTADLVIVPDADRAAVMVRELRLKKPPMIVANAPLGTTPKSRTNLAEALAKQGKSFEKIVLRQGRIGEGHAIEATLQSLKYWTNPQWGFVLLGSAEPAYLEKIANLARSLGVEQQFVVLPPVGYDQVSAYTVGAHLGHALYEPIHINNVHITTASNKIMEYMAAGLPLLVSDTPSLRGLVEKHGCGMAADETSPQSIADAVNILLGDDERAHQMGVAAKRAFDEVFCYERQFAPAIEAISNLCKK